MTIKRKYKPRTVSIGDYNVDIAYDMGKYYWKAMDIAKAIERKGFRSVIHGYKKGEERRVFTGSKSIYLTKEGVKKFLDSSRKRKLVRKFKKAWKAWQIGNKGEEENGSAIRKRRFAECSMWWEELHQQQWTKEEASSPLIPLRDWAEGEFICQRISKMSLMEANRMGEKASHPPYSFFSLLTKQKGVEPPLEDRDIELKSATVKKTILAPPFILDPSEKVVLLPRTGSEELILLKDHCPMPWQIFHLQSGIAVQSCAYESIQDANYGLPKERQKPIPKRNFLADKFILDVLSECCIGFNEMRGPLYVLPQRCLKRFEEIFQIPSWRNVAEFYYCHKNAEKRIKR